MVQKILGDCQPCLILRIDSRVKIVSQFEMLCSERNRVMELISRAVAGSGRVRLMNAMEVVKKLGLQPLEPEGGFFLRTYQSDLMTQGVRGGDRHLVTTIYYLMTPENFSSFHRLPHVEIFHFYAGAPVELTMVSPEGEWKTTVVGNRIDQGDMPQLVVPPNYWQAARIQPGETQEWALLGTTVSPGFDFADFEQGSRTELLELFPAQKELILSLTRG